MLRAQLRLRTNHWAASEMSAQGGGSVRWGGKAFYSKEAMPLFEPRHSREADSVVHLALVVARGVGSLSRMVSRFVAAAFYQRLPPTSDSSQGDSTRAATKFYAMLALGRDGLGTSCKMYRHLRP